jgi:hypothetical protein
VVINENRTENKTSVRWLLHNHCKCTAALKSTHLPPSCVCVVGQEEIESTREDPDSALVGHVGGSVPRRFAPNLGKRGHEAPAKIENFCT